MRSKAPGPILAHMTSRLMKTSLAVLTATLAIPVAAEAAGVTYIDGGNVWVASPDGSTKRELTTDGSAEAPYRLPSADDQGNVVAMHGGSSATKAIVHLAPDGTRTVNVMPWQITSWPNIGPNAARVSPSGGMLAYTYFKNHGPYSGYPNGGFEARLAVVPPTAPGSPTSPLVDQPAWQAPTWVDGKLVVARNGALHVETEPLRFTQFLSVDGLSIERGEVSRAKDRYLVHLRRPADGAEGLVLYAHTGAFPGGEVPGGCEIPTSGQIGRAWGLSPDGAQVAWSDDRGVLVGTFDPASRGADSLCIGRVTVLSPTGEQPAFGAVSLPVPAPPAGGTPAPAPAPDPASATPIVPAGRPHTEPAAATQRPGTAPAAGSPGLVITVPRRVTAAALRRGVRVAAAVPGPGTLTVRAVAAGRTLAGGRTTTRRAGRARVLLRLTGAGRRQAARLRGRAVAVRVAFTPRGGGRTLRSTARVTLR
jgi:hypothetical protein